MLRGPMSRIISSGATLSTVTTREAALASNFRATTASTGSTISQLTDFALTRISRAVATRSRSASDLPTFLPMRQQERVGHAAADDQHVDLGDEVAEEFELGRHLGAAHDGGERTLRRDERLFERVELGLHAASRIGGEQAAEPFGRGMRAVRDREAVVDEDVAERRELAHERRDRSFPRRRGSGCSPGAARRRASSRPPPSLAGSPTQSSANATCRPIALATSAASGASVSFGSRPFGRPRCDSRMTLPPLPAISLMVGAMRAMRVASVTLPSFIGTLRSTRSSTRLPSRRRHRGCETCSRLPRPSRRHRRTGIAASP